jgi:hypothetical protein
MLLVRGGFYSPTFPENELVCPLVCRHLWVCAVGRGVAAFCVARELCSALNWPFGVQGGSRQPRQIT